jgi:hypothetical protein
LTENFNPITENVNKSIVVDLLKALLGNGSVNTSQQPTIGAVFSISRQQQEAIYMCSE